MDRFKTFEVHYAVTTDGWKELVAALDAARGGPVAARGGRKARSRSCPSSCGTGCGSRHVSGHSPGSGQEEELTLRDPEEHYRIEEFIACLRKHRESVEFLDLTLEKLLKVLVLPPQDEPIFIEMMKKELGLNSMQDRIAERLL